MLKLEADACFAEGADVEGQQYSDLLAEINRQMALKIGSAQVRLQQILSKGSVKAMESEVVAMVRRNEVDEALVLLIEANTQMAEAAGAKPAADVLKSLSKRIIEEKERKLPDEQRLLRALMRENRTEKRKELLFEAFKPSKSMNQDGQIVSGAPLISPPLFINVVKQLLTNFGNADKLDIMGRAQVGFKYSRSLYGMSA